VQHSLAEYGVSIQNIFQLARNQGHLENSSELNKIQIAYRVKHFWHVGIAIATIAEFFTYASKGNNGNICKFDNWKVGGDSSQCSNQSSHKCM
jgi:hypothetical protein